MSGDSLTEETCLKAFELLEENFIRDMRRLYQRERRYISWADFYTEKLEQVQKDAEMLRNYTVR